MNVSSILEMMQPALRRRLKRDCKQISFLETPTQEVCLSGGDIYNDPSLLRFYQNDDTSPWRNSKRKEKGEDGPERVVKSKFEDELANFMLEKKSHAKGIGDMLVQHPMIHMPKGAKVLKDLLSHKEKLEKVASSVKLKFNIEICDKKGAENLAADHLSRLEHPDLGKLTRAEIRDLFPEERLMAISGKDDEPWYADYDNYLASRILPFRSTRQEKQKFFNDLRHYFWMSPSYSNSVLTGSYEDAWTEMKQHKFFDNVTVNHLEDITASPPPQGKSSRPGFTGYMSFAMHVNWSKSAMHVSGPETFPQETKYLKVTSKSVKYLMYGG
ncbi:hypothetical protein Tco_1352994 [Tanacetum coccineum]